MGKDFRAVLDRSLDLKQLIALPDRLDKLSVEIGSLFKLLNLSSVSWIWDRTFESEEDFGKWFDEIP